MNVEINTSNVGSLRRGDEIEAFRSDSGINPVEGKIQLKSITYVWTGNEVIENITMEAFEALVFELNGFGDWIVLSMRDSLTGRSLVKSKLTNTVAMFHPNGDPIKIDPPKVEVHRVDKAIEVKGGVDVPMKFPRRRKNKSNV
jgi:hypothetical protein